MKLPPIRNTGVVYFRDREWILTMVLEADGYIGHQVGDIIRTYDDEMEVEVFYELHRRARDEDGKLLPVYEVRYIQPEIVFENLPVIDASKKKPATKPD